MQEPHQIILRGSAYHLLSIIFLLKRDPDYADADEGSGAMKNKPEEDNAGRAGVHSDCLARMLRWLPEVTFALDVHGRIMLWNRAAEELTGRSEDEMLGKGGYEHSLPFYGIRRPMLADMLLNPDPEVETGYQNLSQQGRIVTADRFCPALGETGVFLQASSTLIYDDEGNIVGAIECFRDKTAGRKLEEELLRIKKAVESSTNAIWLTDQRAEAVVYQNEAFTRLFQYTNEEINQAGGTPALYADMNLAKNVYHTLKQKGAWSRELEYRAKDGTMIPVQLYGDVVTDEGGAIIAYLGIATDIREHKRTELELIESQQRLADIIDFLPDATVAIDLEGRVICWNQAMEEMTGVKSEDMIGQDDYAYAVPFYGKRRPILVDLVLKSDEEIDRNYNFITREKGTLVAETSVPLMNGRAVVLWGKANALYDSRGRVAGAIESIRDVTDKIEAERRLTASFQNLQRTLEGTVKALATTTEKKDPYTAGHQERVAGLACAIAAQMGLDANTIRAIRISGMIHDIGKIHLPSDILSKPGRISDLERAMIQTHAQVGYDITSSIPFDFPLALIVGQHHERLNGSGYPNGLAGDQILLEACVICVADVVEAMASHRPYRAALGIEKALEEIVTHRGTLYHPGVVDACLAVFARGYVLESE